jgi:hypothetical protein
MDFKNRETFLPSKETLKKYLGTRKEEHTIGGSPEKPLLADSGISTDSVWVYLVFAIEFLGFILTIIGGAKRSQTFLFISIGAIILIILFDIVAGIKLHKNVARDVWIDAKIPDVSQDVQQQLRNDKNEGKIIKFFLVSGLVIIALFKTIALFFMHPFPGITMYIPMALLFLLASYIHIYHTGYFLAYKKTQAGIDKDYKTFIGSGSGDIDENSINKRISTHTPLRDLPLKAGFHRIEENSNVEEHEEGKYNYIIKMHKLITDDEAIMLCGGQNPENQRVIFKKCRERQFELINVPSGITKFK